MQPRRYGPILVFLAAAVALQVVLSATGKAYYLTQLTMALLYSILVVGLCLLMGYAGQVSLGHAGFFAIGGYTTAVLSKCNLLPYADAAAVRLLKAVGLALEQQDLYGNTVLRLSPWLSLALAMAIAAAAALAVGFPVIRLKGHYLAMATLGFGIIIYRIVLGTRGLGEADGFSDVPPFHLIGSLQVNGRAAFRVQNYYIACGTAAAAMLLSANLVKSRVGRALRSIHENEEAALALGIDVPRHKFIVFMLSAVFAALAGVLMTHYNGHIGPSEATAMKSIRYLAIVAVGGMANLWGALLTGIALNFLSLRGVFGSYDDAVFGLILIGVMLFAPRGIIRLPNVFALLRRKRHDSSAP